MSKLDTKIITDKDPWLEPFVPAIVSRYDQFVKWKQDILSSEGGYDSFSKGYNKFGLNVAHDGTILYREWAPNAQTAHLIGDFSTRSFPSATRRPLTAHRRLGSQHPPAHEGPVRRMGDLHPPSRRQTRHPPRLENKGASRCCTRCKARSYATPLCRYR